MKCLQVQDTAARVCQKYVALPDSLYVGLCTHNLQCTLSSDTMMTVEC